MGKNSKIEIDKRWFPLYQGLIRLEESIIWNKRIISWYIVDYSIDYNYVKKIFKNRLGEKLYQI